MKNGKIDGGREFDWGRTSELYAKYRDIYPPLFYDKLVLAAGIAEGAAVLDIGTGTGVIPRNLYSTGARFVGIDVSPNQIAQARRLAGEGGMDIEFSVCAAEDCSFKEDFFDAVTACQCFTYFDHPRLARKLAHIIRGGGTFTVAYMGWLPQEDGLAALSEELVLKYNPDWTGFGDSPRPIHIPDCYGRNFGVQSSEVFYLDVPFSRESWNGRMLSCRGISAALPYEEVRAFSDEHMKMLKERAPEEFTVKHYAAITCLKKI